MARRRWRSCARSLRFTFAGCLENRHAGVDPAHARARRNQQAVGSSFRSEAASVGVKAAHSAPLMVAMKSSRGGCIKKTHSPTPRSCHFASLRRLQVHDGAQNGDSRVPPDHHWSVWMSVHRGGFLRLFHRQFDRVW
jgi:hypothetical protein